MWMVRLLNKKLLNKIFKNLKNVHIVTYNIAIQVLCWF